MHRREEDVATRELSAQQLASRIWTESRRSEDRSSALELRPDLIPAPALGESDDTSYYTSLLSWLLVAFGGERAFLFTFDRSGGTPPEVDRCLVSVDLDGDPVATPEKKVDETLLAEVAVTQVPRFRPHRDGSTRRDGSARDGRESSLLLIPVLARSCTVAMLVVENRFQDLSADERPLRAAFLYGHLLGSHIDLRRLVDENAGLWQDLSHLRETPGTPEASTSPRPKGEGRPDRSSRRRHLQGDYSVIIGSSPKMLEIFEVIDRISGSTAPVLINGESGTGKELIALAVHRNSPRKSKPFVSENCAAITETLLESELFGYVRGAFTGATRDHKGLFEVADGGTLFLDEVGDMSPSMQKKLLRVLQEGVIRPVGAKEVTHVNVRIISATNKDLMAGCRSGEFREDLYYRLNVIGLKLPPLRDRRDDIAELVEFFLSQAAGEGDKRKRIDAAALQKLSQYSWPGNVRELENEVKKLFALSDGDVIGVHDLSEHLLVGDSGELRMSDWPFELSQMTLKEATEHLEKEMIRTALSETRGNKSLVAKTLQIPKTSLYNKINKYKL